MTVLLKIVAQKCFIKCLAWTILLVWSTGFLAACSRPAEQGVQSKKQVVLDDFKSIRSNSLSIEDWVSLETLNENLMGMDLRVKYADSLILVMDESTKDRIHIFGTSGAYFTSIAPVGEGPGTLPSLEDFEIGRGNEIYVLSTVGDKATVYTASLDGDLSKRFELHYIATSFAHLDDGGFLFYGGFNLPFVTHRIVQTDSEGKILRRYLENDYENTMLPMIERNFYPADSGVFVLETFNPQIYLFRGDSLSPVLRADFEAYSLPAAFWEMDIMEGFGMINEKGFANFRSFFRKDSLIVSDVMIQKEAEVFKYILIQQGENRHKLRADRDEELLYYFPISIDKEERVLFLTYRSILEKHAQQSPAEFPLERLPQEEYDYPVIIHAKIKDNL